MDASTYDFLCEIFYNSPCSIGILAFTDRKYTASKACTLYNYDMQPALQFNALGQYVAQFGV